MYFEPVFASHSVVVGDLVTLSRRVYINAHLQLAHHMFTHTHNN